MAYGMVVVQSRLLQMDRSIEEAAMDLGARPYQVFFLVTMPNIFQAILASFLLAFTLSFDDVVIAEFLSGPGVNTLPQVIFGYARRGINPTIYAAATLLITTVTVAIIGYSDEADAIRIANDTPYGLSGYVQSGDIEHARRVARQIRAGNIHLNGAGVDPAAPFGGYKQSGNGREFSVWGLEEFLETKAILGYHSA